MIPLRWTARALCRAYALLPCLITLPLLALLSLLPHGAAVAWLICALAALPLALYAPDDLPGVVLNTAAYATVLSASLAGLAHLGPALTAGGGGGLALLALALGERLPWLGPRLRPELLPDVFTSLVLGLAFAPLRWLRARTPLTLPEGPYSVAILVASYDEEGTIAECLDSLRAEVERTRLPLREVRIVLADSASTDATRARAGDVEILDCPPGKLSARDHATRSVEVDIVVAADGDRAYHPGWFDALLEPLLAGAVAATGETCDRHGRVGGTALLRRWLKTPFNGGNSAMFRAAYLQSPFDLTVNQFAHKDLWTEEEFLGGLRLRRLGRVAYVGAARAAELRPYGTWQVLARHLWGRRLRTF